MQHQVQPRGHQLSVLVGSVLARALIQAIFDHVNGGLDEVRDERSSRFDEIRRQFDA